jgi:hypothetical protein
MWIGKTKYAVALIIFADVYNAGTVLGDKGVNSDGIYVIHWKYNCYEKTYFILNMWSCCCFIWITYELSNVMACAIRQL